MYLPMDDAQVFSQVSESVHKIKDKNQWEDCNQTVMTLPNYSVCEMEVGRSFGILNLS